MTAANAVLADDRAARQRAFLLAHRWEHASLHPLAGDASFRHYIRARARGVSAMLMDAPPGREDVRPYVRVAQFLRERGYSAPEIIAVDQESGFVLAEDLGDNLFTRALAKAGDAQEDQLYDAAIDLLAAWHSDEQLLRGARSGIADYNEDAYAREVELFAQWFLPAALGEARAKELHQDYLTLWRGLLHQADLPPTRFVHRDFHADNLLWLPAREGVARVGLLDFQDALWGHAAYDMVSLLEDARRDVHPALGERCLNRYFAATGQKREAFMAAYALLGAQRNSKIIGIFVRLSRRDGKHAYLSHLPRVWRYLERDLQHPTLAPLRAWIEAHIPREVRGTLPLPA